MSCHFVQMSETYCVIRVAASAVEAVQPCGDGFAGA
jgi:hypothetical protein